MTEQFPEEIDYEAELEWATVDAVHLDWIDGAPPMSDAVIAYQLYMAEDKILSEFPDIQKRIDRGEVRLRTVRRVAVNVAMRRLTNPNFQRSISRTDGPFQSTVTTGGDHPGTIYLSDEDRSDLRGRGASRRAFSITPSF